MAAEFRLPRAEVTRSVREHTGPSSYTRTTDGGTTNKIVVEHVLTDNGTGAFTGSRGTVNYAGKTASVRFVTRGASTTAYKSEHEDPKVFAAVTEARIDEAPLGSLIPNGSTTNKGGSYGASTIGEELLAASTVAVSYAVAGSTANGASVQPQDLEVLLELAPGLREQAVPGSVQFAWMGTVYVDSDTDGGIYRGRTDTDPGILSGRMNYAARTALMTDWVAGPNPRQVTVQSLWTQKRQWTAASLFGRTSTAPIRPGGFTLLALDTQGDTVTGIVDNSGLVSGTHITGVVDYETGTFELQFGDYVLDSSLTAEQKAEWWYSVADVGAVQPNKIWRPWPVDPTTLRYTAVSYSYLPIDATVLGLDPTRLPPDGRVPIFRQGELVVIGRSIVGNPVSFTSGQAYNVGATRLSLVRLVDANGLAINSGYTVNLDAGTLVVNSTVGWAQPVTVHARVEVLRRLADVQVDGTLRLTAPIGTVFTAGCTVSSVLFAGDLFARVSRLFDQATWSDGQYPDAVVGSAALGTYNDTAFPIEVSNLGALTERWALRFKNSSEFDLIGRGAGLIASGTINADFSPINPASGAPYFTIRSGGWGLGWATGNVLFLHTVGASFPVALIRTTQPGAAAGLTYTASIEARGDVDRPPSNPIP